LFAVENDLLKDLKSEQWQQLDELILKLKGSDKEFLISWAMGQVRQNAPWLEIGKLEEQRFPLSFEELMVSPHLADRTVVARLNQAVLLPPGETVVLYVGSPLWLQFRWREHMLLDLPLARLSDTWFGPNTRSGELCYASETHARLNLNDVGPRPYKAFTQVEIKNLAEDMLKLERINIPVPNLSLFHGDDRWWTGRVRVTRNETGGNGEIKVFNTPDDGIQRAEEISRPRVPVEGGIVKKALNLLFS